MRMYNYVKSISAVLILTLLIGNIVCVKLPSYLPKCRKVKQSSDIPEFEKCFVDVGHKWRYYFKKGIPEIGIPPLNNVVIPKIKIEQNGSLSFDLNIYNMSVIGLPDYEYEYFKYQHLPDPIFRAAVKQDLLQLNGTYDLDGDLFGISFGGNGPWRANLTDIRVNGTLYSKLYMKKGVQYINFTKIDSDIEIGGASGQLENFFGDNDLLNSALNNFLNEFSLDIIESVKPSIKKLIRKVVFHIARRFRKIPYDSQFLEE